MSRQFIEAPVVQVFMRSTYGQQRVYPANRVAEQLAAFAGVKTFSNPQLRQIRDMGLVIEQVQDPKGVITA